MDSLLIISNFLFGVSILGYFYFREIKKREDDNQRIEKLEMFYSQVLTTISVSIDQWTKKLQEISKSKDDLVQKTLLEYLKHNERLEKMVLPQPVTKKAVQDVLSTIPPLVPNEIEKTDKDLEQEQLSDLLSRIPITKDTKVMIEGMDGKIDAGLAEEVVPSVS